MEKAETDRIGSFKTFISKTEAQQSSAEGKGISEATVGLETQLVLITRNAKGEQCYEERDSVTVDIRNQGHDCTTKVRVQDNRDGTYKISYFGKETGKCDVSVKVNDEHIRGSPFDVQVKPRQYRLVLSFGQYGSSAGMLFGPRGLAVNERDEIAVTGIGNDSVQVFNSDGTHLRSFGRKGGRQDELNWPFGIAFYTNSNIIVADTGRHQIKVFSEQGEYLNQFGEQGSLDHQFKYPFGLSVDSDGNIIVADSDNKLIKIFSPSGQFLRKIGGKGSFTHPIHCVEYDKYLIVSDRDEHCIKVFSRDGNFLYKFGKKGERDGEFKFPCYLSVNEAGHLMVCDSCNHRVQVFELSGKLVTKFGTEGSALGEFNNPCSTAVLSDDKLNDLVTHVDIQASIKTDHSSIILELEDIKDSQRGPGFWKLNTSLLARPDYVEMISKELPNWLEDARDLSDKRAKWDWLKFKIKTSSIIYSKQLSKDRQRREEELNARHQDMLYSKQKVNLNGDEANFFFQNPNLKRLSEELSTNCEGEITLQECENILGSFHTGKTPGNDGIPIEFYKAFWPLLGKFMVDSFNEAFYKKEMSHSQKQAVITLIEKKGKERNYLENWRPISLTNVDAKIASKVIAARVIKVLPEIIHCNQTGYVKGRFIGEAARSIIDIMDYTKKQNIPEEATSALAGLRADPLSRSSWNEGGKPENPEKNPGAGTRTNNKHNPPMAPDRNRTWATLTGGERIRNCSIPAPLFNTANSRKAVGKKHKSE
ncbi:hypothetical protein ACROYT_G008824 [Oculina patagonica]